MANAPFFIPLVEPDVPISGIRLSDWFRNKAFGGIPAPPSPCNRASSGASGLVGVCMLTANRPALGSDTLAELRRDMERRRLISDQIRQIEDARLERLERMPNDGPDAMVRLLARVIGVGIETTDMLVQDVPSQTMLDRQAVARYVRKAIELLRF